MAHFRGIGGLTTILKDQTQYWEYSYGKFGSDVGIAYAAPNLLESNINVELVALEQGVTERDEGENVGLVYTVRIHNNGVSDMSYNLNIEDWQ
jgi:hypothetical protein